MSRQGSDTGAFRSHSDGRGIVLPFLLGTVVGGLAGAVVGTALSGQAAHLLRPCLTRSSGETAIAIGRNSNTCSNSFDFMFGD